MRVVYVAHPLGAGPDREGNLANAAKWCAWIASLGHAPVADWIILARQFGESAAERQRGLEMDCVLVARCDELWLCGGRISPGMAIEAETAARFFRPVWNLVELGREPPPLGMAPPVTPWVLH